MNGMLIGAIDGNGVSGSRRVREESSFAVADEMHRLSEELCRVNGLSLSGVQSTLIDRWLPPPGHTLVRTNVDPNEVRYPPPPNRDV